MILPLETHLALTPPSRRVGNCTVGPLTLGGALALDALGVSLPGRISGGDVALAAWVLSGGDADDRDGFAKWAKRLDASRLKLEEAVNAAVDEAFRCQAKTAPPKDAPIRNAPHGWGWPLELAEFCAEEFGWAVDYALALPVATAYGLMAAWCTRNRVQLECLDYHERAFVREKKHGRLNG